MNMNKEFYLKRLRSLIRALPNDERRTIIDFYREIIEDKIENGQTEAQAVVELGDVHALAGKILSENPNRKPHDANRIAGIVLASFFGVIIVAAIVVNALNVVNFKSAATAYSKNVAEEAGPTEEKTVTVPVAEVTDIYIDAENKDVTITRGDGADIRVNYVTDKTQSFIVTTTNGVVKLINRSRTGHSIFHFFYSISQGHTKISVSVPQSFAGELYLNTSNGKISVSDMEQVTKLTCDTSNGSIRLNSVNADSIDADTSNAEIQLIQVTSSDVNASSSNAKIVLKDLTAPRVVLDTSNADITGNLCGREEDYDIHTSTSNGNCSPSSRSGGNKNLTADTSNGNIDLAFKE